MAVPEDDVVLLVDASNVIGARPDGWWRDRPAAVRRLLARLQRLAAATGSQVVLVLDAAQPDLPDGVHGGVAVRSAERRGRDAADERILALLEEAFAVQVRVVTSDRALADGARRRGAQVVGAGAFLRRLDALGC